MKKTIKKTSTKNISSNSSLTKKRNVKKISKTRSKNFDIEQDEKGNPVSKHWFALFFLAILVLAIIVIKPFLSALIIGGVLAYVLYPLYQKILKRVKSKSASAGLIIVLLILILTLPLIFITTQATQESYELYQKAKVVYDEQSEIGFCNTTEGIVCRTYHSVTKFITDKDINIQEKGGEIIGSLMTKMASAVTGAILNLPSILFQIFITLFIIFYMLVDGEKIVDSIKSALPLKQEHRDGIVQKFSDMIHATIHGALIIALIQGVLALIGYIIFGAPSPILLGFLTMVFSVVPLVGTGLIWLPTTLTMIIAGLSSSDNGLLFQGIGLFIYCLVIVASADNILRPKIVGDKAKIHPVMILLGVFGGLAVFGVSGIIIGPLILTLFVTILKIYKEEKDYISVN